MNKQKQENQQDKKYQNKTHMQSSNMGWKILSDLLSLHFFPLPVSHRVRIYALLLYRSTTSSLWKAHFGIFILSVKWYHFIDIMGLCFQPNSELLNPSP